MRAAADLSGLFHDALLLRSNENIGFLKSVRKLIQHARSDVIFVEDDWRWHGRLLMRRVQDEVKRQGCHAYSFRNPCEYVGAMGCCYWSFETVNVLRYWKRVDVISTEKDVKRLMRHYGHKTMTKPGRRLHDIRVVEHMGPAWSSENGLGGSTRID